MKGDYLSENKLIHSRLPKSTYDEMESLIEKKDINGKSEFVRRAVKHYIRKLQPPETRLERKRRERREAKKKIEKLEEEIEELKNREEKKPEREEEIKEQLKDDLEYIVEDRGFDRLTTRKSIWLLNDHLKDEKGYVFTDDRKVREMMQDVKGDFRLKVDKFVEKIDEEGLIDYDSVMM